MSTVISEILTHPLADILTVAVVHSLWIFTAIAAILYFTLKLSTFAQGAIRFRLSIGALMLSLMAFLLIMYFEINILTHLDTAVKNESSASTEMTYLFAYASSDQADFFNSELIFLIWLTGVMIFMIRYIFSWGYVLHISSEKYRVENPVLSDTLYNMIQEINSDLKVKIAESKSIATPVLTGIISPVILFPVGLVNHLSIAETRAIIAHELAHIIRKDLLVNVFLHIMEILFYYHPAIWWITSIAKTERENSCDDLALSYQTDRLILAGALIKVQEMSSNQNNPSSLVLAFNHSKYFSNRIKRILNMKTNMNYFNGRIVGLTLATAVVLMFTLHLTGKNNDSGQKETFENRSFLQSPFSGSDTIPSFKKESIIIQKKTDDKDVKLSIENGEVKELIIDGKKIDEKDFDKYEDIIAEVKPEKSPKANSFFFFDNDGSKGSFRFDFRNRSDFDSMFNNMDENLFMPFGFDKGNQRDMMDQLKKQMESMKFDFNFDFPENFEWNKREFGMPEIDELMKRLEKKGFQFEGGPQMFNFDFDVDEDGFDATSEWKSKESNVNEILGDALNRDGFLIPGKENKVELTGKYLKINGEKQPTNIWNKYKRIVEDVYGTELSKNSKLVFSITGKEPKRKYRIF